MVVFLIYFLPMVLPTLIYALWRLWRARRSTLAASIPQDAGDGTADGASTTPETINWREAPWLWLVLAGAALLVLVLLTGIFTEGVRDEGRYIPPRMENGRILPGEMRPIVPEGAQPESDGAAPRTNGSAPP